ncbi:eif-3.F, partial [Pristionchus pacificus]
RVQLETHRTSPPTSNQSIIMASFLTVKVHPVVYLTIVDSYERRARQTKQGAPANDKALGTLMGFYEKGAVQVTNCFAIPFNENTDEPELDDSFNMAMVQMLKRAAPTEQPVGWFYTSSELTNVCIPYHDYYNRIVADFANKKDTPPVILLTLDTTFTEDKHRMPIRAFQRSKAGIPGNREPHCAIFNPLRVELDAFPAEFTALKLIQKGMDDKSREIRLESGLEQLERSTGEIVAWLERIEKYVDEVLSREEEPADATMGRTLMEIVNTAATHMQSDKLDSLVKNSLRDYMMISYLSQLTKTQLQLHDKLVAST